MSAADSASERRFTFAEFFAGVGGFRLALEAAGGQCVFACEYCRFCHATYKANWPRAQPVGDIHRISAAQVPRHDVLAAGFPCQSFSNAGRLGRLGDDRGQLFYELVRIITACQPRALLLENVRGLLTHEDTLNEVLRALAAAGYPQMHVAEMDAAAVVPQRRRRVYLVGFRSTSARAAFVWPRLPALRRTADAILEAGPLATDVDMAEGSAKGVVGVTAIAGLALSCDKWSKVAGSAYYAKFPASRLLAPGALAQTLQATYKSGCLLYSQFVPTASPADVPSPPRFYSPRECARLMGFPEAFILPTGDGLAHRQLGNAVVPPLVAAIAVAIAGALESAAASEPAAPSAADGAYEAVMHEREAARRAATQCEATATALAMALAASPTSRPPRSCWLHAEALSALGDEDLTTLAHLTREDATTRAAADDADAPGRYRARLRPDGDGWDVSVTRHGSDVDRSDDSEPACTRGADYHAPLDDEWYGPLPLVQVLQRARVRSGAGWPPPPRLPIDRAAPVQTMPDPTTELKREVALRCMRRWSDVQALRSTLK